MPEISDESPRYLQNTEQVLEPEESTFSGDVPSWFRGDLYASSPGIFDLEKASVLNWFDGYAILSRFSVQGNKVTFCSKHLQSTAYKKAKETGRPVFPEFGTPPFLGGKVPWTKVRPFGPYDCTDNAIGTIFRLGPSLYTAGDTCYYHEIDPENLSTLKSHHTAKAFGLNSVCSQPLEDEDGNIYLIGGAAQPTFRYSVLKMPQAMANLPLEKRFSVISTFPSRWMFGACPSRNFGMTENFIIMIEMPLVLSLVKLASTFVKSYCATDWLDWRPEDGVRFIIVRKSSGEVLKTEVFADKAFFTPSIVNAFEDGNEIILDLITMPNLATNRETGLSILRNRPETPLSPEERPLDSGTVQRFVIPVIPDLSKVAEGESLLQMENYPNSYSTLHAEKKGGRIIVTPEALSAPGLGLDFQVINPNYRGKRYTFVYGTSGYISTRFSPYAHSIAKINMETREVKMWRGERGQIPSEPVFIPDPTNLQDEDAGVVLSLISNERRWDLDDFLVLVNAKTMEEVGRATFKSGIAGWFHANFFQKL